MAYEKPADLQTPTPSQKPTAGTLQPPVAPKESTTASGVPTLKPAADISMLLRKRNPLSNFLTPLSQLTSKLNKTTKKMIYAAAGLFGVIFLLIIVGLIVSGLRRAGGGGGKVPVPTAAPGNLPTQAPISPSRYATDADVLSAEEALKNIDQELNAIELKDSYLAIPRVEFNITFPK
jgi:hypothetical protein